MATIAQQLTELVNQKNALAANLNTKGVTASSDETLNTLVPKVLDIQTGGSGENKFGQLVDGSIDVVTENDLNGTTEIKSYAFYSCRSLASITIPNSVTSIGSNAFYSCVSLKSIIIPDSVTNIYSYAFYFCTTLASITISNNITRIYDQTFRSCSSLKSITIPDSVISIGGYAFADCRSLASITIPNNVTSIGNKAFRDCDNLTSMRIEATTPPTLSNTNAISTATTQIQVPMASVEAYKTATNWSNFADIIVGYEEETT